MRKMALVMESRSVATALDKEVNAQHNWKLICLCVRTKKGYKKNKVGGVS